MNKLFGIIMIIALVAIGGVQIARQSQKAAVPEALMVKNSTGATNAVLTGKNAAEQPNGSSKQIIGCTNKTACNYDKNANKNGMCTYAWYSADAAGLKLPDAGKRLFPPGIVVDGVYNEAGLEIDITFIDEGQPGNNKDSRNKYPLYITTVTVPGDISITNYGNPKTSLYRYFSKESDRDWLSGTNACDGHARLSKTTNTSITKPQATKVNVLR